MQSYASASLPANNLIVMYNGAVAVSGSPREALTAQALSAVYGVTARLETCSRGRLQVIVDDIAT